MKIKVTAEGKMGSEWKVLEQAVINAPGAIPIKWVIKGPFGIKVTLVGRIRIEPV